MASTKSAVATLPLTYAGQRHHRSVASARNQPRGARSRIAYPISGLPAVLIGSPHPSRHALYVVQVRLTGVVGRIAVALVARALE
jgi:hypothetical protein